MALTFSSSQAASREVESVSFGFFTSDEARRISIKAITRPDFHDARGFPVPDGLCDPALGTLNDTDSCKTCGLLSFTCPGHCGHIDLALTVYNPLLFRSLCKLLHITCISCNRFRMKSDKAHFYVSKLNLIMKGDVAGARKLKLPSSFFKSKKGDMDGSEPVDDVPAFVDEEEACTMEDGSVSEVLASPMGPKRTNWTSLQQTEAYSVLTEIMHEIRKECENCCFKNPKIWSPVHGIIEMEMRDSDIRANVIGRLNRENVSSDSGIDSLIGVDVSKSDGSPSEIQTGLASDQWTNLPADFIKQKKLTSIQLLPYKVKLLLRNLWRKEGKLCELICDIQQKTLHVSTGKDYNIFFMDVIIVPPCKFRPTAKGNDRDRLLQHPQNILLAQVLESNISLRDAKMNNAESSVVFRRWKDLQRRVNVLFDSSKGFAKDKEAIGLRQLLEKKAGILRQKMMGKRVNFACRSVISPDPFLAVNEIGIPPHFAMTLTYPERVTPWNANRLRHAVICGTDVHPGATHFKDKERVYRLNIPRNVRLSISRKLSTSRTSHMHSRKGPDSDFEGKVVHRHLRNGDVVLVNRQPTLHKLSIKGHVVRVLEGEKTLRFHYTNCNSYNADFDGDEMNVHLPQDEISRAEAINIVNANKQYTLPTSGKPDRGLIQDHIVSAVLLTKIDTFLNREEYNQLLYASCIPPICSDLFTSRKKVNLLSCDWEIEPVPPAILKPVPLWTGKQVISAILNYVTRDQLPCNVRKTAKTSADYLGGNSGTFKSKEHKVRILNNEIIHGIIDKEQFGSFGLVHTVNELYGSDAAGALLSSFSRLFTVFLQMHGFTCGIDDLLTVPESEAQRRKELNKSKERSREAHCSFLRIDSSNDLDQRELQLQVEKVSRENGESATAILDRKMVNAMGVLTKTIANQLIPNGLKKPFARNCVTLMTTTGAKGKMDNFIQISALLGQQQLEGKRVPSMVSGKTLPCFPPYDTAPRAGGFIGDRFLTGLRLQEYYFHCMAGREGLVDTAVKTSRSGYLQRCLVKNLEALRVCYDHTVRDADGSIIQFLYGEDGIDAHQTGFLHQFKSIDINKEVIFDRLSSQGMQGCFSVSNSFFKGLPEKIKDGVENYITKMSKERKRKKHFPHRCKKENFLKLMELKYLSSLCPPGEAVGVLAAQSVGEPSTQMTLNTFHHAGRGEMNVTLGIPRLQEIYMNAKQNIKTPIMTCPLHVGLTEKDAIVLSEKLGRVSVADIIESLEVRVVPLVVSDKEASTIYKLKIKIYSPELFPPQIGLTLENCMAILADNFVVAVSAAIEKHLAALLRFKDIQVGSQVVHDTSMDENGEDESGSDPVKETGKNDDDGGGSDIDEDDDGDDEDLGADAEKRKLQSRDEMEYDDNENEKQKTTILSSQALEVEESEIESEIDQSESDQDQAMEEEDEGSAQVDVEKQEKHSELEDGSRTIVGEHVSTDGKKSVLKKKKKNERAIYVKAEGRELEVHFKSKGEPHLLLAEIAQKTAKNVFLKQVKNIERCTVLPDKEGEKVWMLQTAGVDFSVFWDQEDYLDINKISSNDIHAVLNTYGVEAARATIVNEVNSLFKHYEVSLDTRHLNLIADFITVGGDYRPMNRNGVTKYSTSPFGKITFETATKFIIEAAFHGESDTLEGPSSSICLGQPVKLGTGMFDVMHNF